MRSANRLLWAAVAFVLVIRPLSLYGGIFAAAQRRTRPPDRIISITGLSVTVVPEFVSGIILILIFGVWLKWLPISAKWADGADIWERLRHLLLPALPLVLILFGYIARGWRAPERSPL